MIKNISWEKSMPVVITLSLSALLVIGGTAFAVAFLPHASVFNEK
jgi:hypothetical protein